MKVEIDIQEEAWMPTSLKESIDSARNMISYYEKKLAEISESDPNHASWLAYYKRCLKESQKDLKALKRVHNYYTPQEEHID